MGKGRRRSREPSGSEPGSAADGVQPLDVDGVRTVAIVTVGWAVAFVVLAFRIDSLQAGGTMWWLWTCLAGVGLGLLGLEYTRRRRDAIEAAGQEEDADEPPDAAVEPANPVGAPPLEGTPPLAQAAPPGGEQVSAAEPAGPGGPPGAGGIEPPSPELTSPEPALRTVPPSSTEQSPRTELPPEHGLRRAAAEPADSRSRPEQSSPNAITRPIDAGTGAQRVQQHGDPAAPDATPQRVRPAWPDSPGAAEPQPGRRRRARAHGPSGELPASELFADIPHTPAGTASESPPETARTDPPRAETSRPGGLAPEASRPERLAAAEPAPGEIQPAGGDLLGDDEPLLDGLANGRRARRYDITEEIGEITEGGGRMYRGRRARRSDSA